MERGFYVRRRTRRSFIQRFFNIIERIIVLVLIICIGKIFLAGYLPKRNLRTEENTNVVTPDITFDKTKISKEVPDEAVYSLEAMALKDQKVLKILRHSEEYPPVLLESLSKNPELLDFTLDYPEKKDTWKQNINIRHRPGQIPLLIQWNEDWGYAPYGNGIIGLDGCGPTCLAMVASGLTGDDAINPKTVAKFSEENGYIDESGATLWSLMTDGANKLGLHSKVIALDEQRMASELSQGHPIICSMRPGDFTTRGHFIVLYGYRDGEFLVHDPNSKIRSQKTWSYSRLQPQIKNLWVFSR